MVEGTTKIVNRMGLHARPASTFVVEAKKYDCTIKVGKVGSASLVNAKSIMMILGASINKGDEIRIVCDGEDEEAALAAMIAAVDGGLGDLPDEE